MRWPPGTIVDDRAEILGFIGAGGMGSVYRAKQVGFDRLVALKILNESCNPDEENYLRFQREALLLSKFQHKNIANFYGFGLWRGAPYMLLELLEGTDLEQLLKRGTLSISTVLEILQQVCLALECAHAHGAVHRDIKPSNVIVSADGTAKVIDFGLAKTMSKTWQALTEAGTTVGSVLYMAPEQCIGSPCAPATDIYSVGCMMYHLLTGQPVFNGDSPVAIMQQHLNAAIPSFDPALDLPQSLNEVLSRCLAKDAAKRLSNAAELAETLGNIRKALTAAQASLHVSRTEQTLKREAGARKTPSAAGKTKSPVPALCIILGVAVLAFGGTLAYRTLIQRDLENQIIKQESRLSNLKDSPQSNSRVFFEQYMKLAAMQNAISNLDRSNTMAPAAALKALQQAATYAISPEQLQQVELAQLQCASLRNEDRNLIRHNLAQSLQVLCAREISRADFAGAKTHYKMLLEYSNYADTRKLLSFGMALIRHWHRAGDDYKSYEFFRRWLESEEKSNAHSASAYTALALTYLAYQSAGLDPVYTAESQPVGRKVLQACDSEQVLSGLDHTLQASLLVAAIMFVSERKDTPRMRNYLPRALQQVTLAFPMDSDEYANSLSEIAICALGLHDARGPALAEKAIQLLQQKQRTAKALEAEFALAGYYSDERDYTKSLALCNSSIEHAAAVKDQESRRSIRTRFLLIAAGDYLRSGKETECDRLCDLVQVKLRKANNDYVDTAALHNLRAECLLKQNKPQQAIREAQLGLETAEKVSQFQPTQKICSLLLLSSAFAMAGDLEQARHCLRQAKAMPALADLPQYVGAVAQAEKSIAEISTGKRCGTH